MHTRILHFPCEVGFNSILARRWRLSYLWSTTDRSLTEGFKNDCHEYDVIFVEAISALLAVGIALVALATATMLPGEELTTVNYHGIRPSDPGGRKGVRNPERGWRIETVIAEPHQKVFIGPAPHLAGQVPPLYQDDWWLLDAKRFEPFGLTWSKRIAISASSPTGHSGRRSWTCSSGARPAPPPGLKALLRFAYEKDMTSRTGPSRSGYSSTSISSSRSSRRTPT